MFYMVVKGHMFIWNYLKACGIIRKGNLFICNVHVIQKRTITKFRRYERDFSSVRSTLDLCD